MSSFKAPSSVYLTLAAGIAIGALSMNGVRSASTSTTALRTSSYSQQDPAPRAISSTSTESMAELRNLDASMANLAEFVAPAVVHITSENDRKMGPNGARVPISGGQGSGFVYRPDGWIVTNDHVVGGFDKVTVILKDGREFAGTVRRAEDSDIALVKIDAKDLPTLAFADSERVRPGQISMAIGAPFGLDNSVTVGHISALGRINQIEGKLYPDLIQTDTAINMGNSGGPLVNIDGQVIGINTAIYSPTGVSGGIGFAIPSNQARLVTDILMKDGKLTRSMLKIVPEDLKDFQKKDMNLPDGGALVTDVQSDGPGAAAGIQKGDVIVKIGDTPVHGQLELRNAMLLYRPGTSVPIEVVRNGQHKTLHATLVAYERPKVAAQPGMPQMPGGPDFQFPRDFNDFHKWFDEQQGQGQGPDDRDQNVPDVPAIGDHPKLGINVGTPDDSARKQYHIPASVTGALVTGVVPGSPADSLGAKPGDVVTEFAGKKIRSADDLIAAVREVKAGDRRHVTFTRFTANGQMTISQDVTFK